MCAIDLEYFKTKIEKLEGRVFYFYRVYTNPCRKYTVAPLSPLLLFFGGPSTRRDPLSLPPKPIKTYWKKAQFDGFDGSSLYSRLVSHLHMGLRVFRHCYSNHNCNCIHDSDHDYNCDCNHNLACHAFTNKFQLFIHCYINCNYNWFSISIMFANAIAIS